MAVLLTTTISLDATQDATQAVIHLKKGDAGTRALRFVPVSGGAPVSFASVAAAKLRAHPDVGTDLLIDCTLGTNYADLTPTAALVADAVEYSCELLLLDASNNTLTTAEFSIIVHATVYDGDAVEHTNNTVGSLTYDTDGRLTVTLLDGTVVKAPVYTHTHGNATESTAGFMSAADKAAHDTAVARLDQDVKQASSPTFAGLTVGTATISATGVCSGLRFG